MKKYILICIALVSTAFASPSLDDLAFEWVDSAQHTEIAPELRNLIQTNHSMICKLLGDAITAYFDEAVAIVLAKEDDKIVGYCSISQLHPAESTLLIECAFVDPAYRYVGISEKLVDMMFERYSDYSRLLLKPSGFQNYAW